MLGKELSPKCITDTLRLYVWGCIKYMSMGARCDHIDHVKIQVLYALFVAAIIAIFGYVPVNEEKIEVAE